MGLGAIGVPSLILILVVALVIFGPSKLPEIGKAAGQTLREFKKSTSGIMGDESKDETESETKQASIVESEKESNQTED